MEAMGIIFSNIYDSKMGNLTWERTSGSIPFGGRYRQIDFVLSNMSNSGIRNIGIITKYNYQSLMDHLANCEDWDLHLGENVRFLPPYATGHTGAYRGKLMIVSDPTRLAVGVIDEFSEENAGRQLPYFLKKYNAVAAVNAGGFNDFGGTGNGGTPVGLVIENGAITFGSEDEAYSICGFDRNGMLYVGSMTGKQALEAGVISACSFGPALIINGKPVQLSSSGVNPRTAIGQRADGAILLLTLAGRQIDCIGATLADLTEILYAYGAVNATNLDGGSSTMMYYKGERQIKSSSLVGERFLPTAIIVR